MKESFNSILITAIWMIILIFAFALGGFFAYSLGMLYEFSPVLFFILLGFSIFSFFAYGVHQIRMENKFIKELIK